MKKSIFLSFLLLGQIALGQTNELIQVPGTKCSLIPPSGFVLSTTFSGFQNSETGTSIMVNEIPAPYQTTVDGFTTEALMTKGMTLLTKKIIDFNNSKATLLYVTQPANGMTYIKQILIFGDEKGTVLVNGIYPKASKEDEEKIKEALLSTVYNIDHEVNPLDAATFTIEIRGTDFKLIKYMQGALLYSTDGKIPTEKPTLIVGNSIGKIPFQDQKKYAEERLGKYPRGELNVIEEIKEITIDDLKGYEIIAHGKTQDNKPELIYQVMIFNDKGDYYVILGRAKEDFERNLETFKKIAITFKLK
jgi:hypothetical protein